MLQGAEKEAVQFLFSRISIYFTFFVGYLFLKMLLVTESVYQVCSCFPNSLIYTLLIFFIDIIECYYRNGSAL